jgi:hypothetical protein
MEAAHPTQSQSLPTSPTSPNQLRPVFTDAVRFWEPRRLFYNLVLLAAALSWLAATWPHFRPALALTPILMLSVLALLANVCYSAAYLSTSPSNSPLSPSLGSATAGFSGSLEPSSPSSSQITGSPTKSIPTSADLAASHTVFAHLLSVKIFCRHPL